MVCFTREVYGFFNVKEINCDVQEILLSTLFTPSLWVEDKKKRSSSPDNLSMWRVKCGICGQQVCMGYTPDTKRVLFEV